MFNNTGDKYSAQPFTVKLRIPSAPADKLDFIFIMHVFTKAKISSVLAHDETKFALDLHKKHDLTVWANILRLLLDPPCCRTATQKKSTIAMFVSLRGYEFSNVFGVRIHSILGLRHMNFFISLEQPFYQRATFTAL